MDESTAEQWAVIGKETVEQPGPGRRPGARTCCGRSADITDGFAIDQLTHCLQTATLAERAGADDEVVVAALLPRHRQGRQRAEPPEIAAAILKPYVRAEVLPR